VLDCLYSILAQSWRNANKIEPDAIETVEPGLTGRQPDAIEIVEPVLRRVVDAQSMTRINSPGR
jgi:hypothetical protein